jgi:predicted amidohydrolase
MDDVRVAAVVMQSGLGETADNLSRMKNWVGAAVSDGADVVCFPELNVTGYSVREKIRSTAEAVPGPSTEALIQMAADSGIVILAGLVERDREGRLYATHLVVSPEGLRGVYRKTHLSPFEHPLYSGGNTVPVFRLPGGAAFGIELCYDTHFPELSALLALKGVDILFCPHASPRGTPEDKLRSWLRHLTARAYDNGVFVVACNQTGDNGDSLEFPGLALALNPSGEMIAQRVTGEEGLLVADLKGSDLAHVRENRMRFFLPNRRPELYGGLTKETAPGDAGVALFGKPETSKIP